MSIGVVLRGNGSVLEYEIVPSYITPTYRLTYEDVLEMATVAGAEEPEMLLLMEASQKRASYRHDQGAVEMHTPEAEVKVKDPDSPEPRIALSIISQSEDARRLISELMILCGEVVADFGAVHRLPLPYRGQQAVAFSEEAEEELKGLSGLSLAAHLRLGMNRSSVNCTAPVPHSALGLAGYVQFSSPIRRYGDLLAHYQIKACLRGETPPLTSSQLEKIMLGVGSSQRSARKVESATQKYWILEYLRRLPVGVPLPAVLMRWIKQDADALALVHLLDVGFETTIRMSRRAQLGARFHVVITEVHPRKGLLRLAETAAPHEEGEEDMFGPFDEEGSRQYMVPAAPSEEEEEEAGATILQEA